MAEYIERSEALDKCGWYNTVNGKSICAVRKDELAAIPAADVVEVKHGRWERDELFAPYCTVCGESPMSALRPEGNYRYCPNCGARMDGE